MLKQRLEQDLKQALLSGDKERALVLRSLKSAILYAEVSKGVRDTGLPDDEIIALLSKEVKKRQESADLYIKGGAQDRADKELAEKKIIEAYLPQQLSDEALLTIIDEAITEIGAQDMSDMGQVIGAIKRKTGASADGARIARMVKEKLA